MVTLKPKVVVFRMLLQEEVSLCPVICYHLLCAFSQRDVNNCVSTLGRALTTNQRKNPRVVGGRMSLLGRVTYRSVGDSQAAVSARIAPHHPHHHPE